MQQPFSRETKNLVLLVYLLQLLSILFGITAIIGILINHAKYQKLKDSVAESHFRWQILTFWISLAVFILGILLPAKIGAYLMLAAGIWMYYRAIRGFLYLRANRTAPAF